MGPKKERRKDQLMWEAYHSTEIVEKISNWEHKRELCLDSTRFRPDFLNKNAKCTENLEKKIYHLENELGMLMDRDGHNNDWIKELYKVCQKEIKQTKEILSKIYELKSYYKPILYKEGRSAPFDHSQCCSVEKDENIKRQNPNLAIDQELYTFGLNPPLWIGSQNEAAPPGCGSVPHKLLQKKVSKKADISEGQYVAVFVILDQKIVEIPVKKWNIAHNFIQLPEDPENGYSSAKLKLDGSWILARCIRIPEGKRREYIVADIDDVDDIDDVHNIDDTSVGSLKIFGKALPHFRVPRKALIPLPLYNVDPEFNPEAIFPIGADVLALYKETTSFFPAVVEDIPKSVTDPYKLRFKDENQIQNQVYLVLQKYVIEYRDVGKIFSREEIGQLEYMKKID